MEKKSNMMTMAKKSEQEKHALSNIAEVTEDDQTIREQRKAEKIGDEDRKNSDGNESRRVSLFQRSVNCVRYFCHKLLPLSSNENEIKIEESQISEILNKLRRRKTCGAGVLPPPINDKLKTLVLDLDETLVFTTFRKPERFDYKITLEGKNGQVAAYVTKRFGLESFLFEMSKIYEIVVFSSSKRRYIDEVLERIDPKKRISHSLSREHCTVINQSYFIKPLKNLGRDQSKIIVVDDNRMSASLNPENLYKIDSFKGSGKDRSLIKLSHFLTHIHDQNDILPIELHQRQFESKEIRIKEAHLLSNKYQRAINSEFSSTESTEQGSSVAIMIHQGSV